MIYFIYRNPEDEPQFQLSTVRFSYVQRRRKCLEKLQHEDLDFAEQLLFRACFGGSALVMSSASVGPKASVCGPRFILQR